jgi:hypothetical protein
LSKVTVFKELKRSDLDVTEKNTDTECNLLHPKSQIYCEKVKGKVVPVHVIKAYRGSRGIVPLILNLDTDEVEWLTSCPQLFYPAGRTPVPNEEEVRWAPEPE